MYLENDVKFYTCHDVDVIACHFLQKCLRISIGGRHLGWINKQSARNFSWDRTGSPPRSVVFYGFGTFTWSLFSFSFEAIEQWPACKSSADCAIYKRFGQRLFCFDCLFTNLQVPSPSIADSWHITFSRRKWRHI